MPEERSCIPPIDPYRRKTTAPANKRSHSMPPLFWLKQVVKLVALPPVAPLLLAFVGLALIRRRPYAGRRIAVVGVVTLWLLATPAVADFLQRCLDRTPPLALAKTADAQAIVILGGGTRRFAAEYGGATIGGITLDRIRYGAWLARATKLPILVSGGAVRGAPPEALMMRDVLENEFGVPVRWMEMHSRNTHENAVDSAKVLTDDGVRSVILVGHSFDFPRSRKEFEAAGINVIPAPIGIPPAVPHEFGDFVPSPSGLSRSYFVLYEMLANTLFWMQHGSADASRSVALEAPEVATSAGHFGGFAMRWVA
jgi:uncharacterized SAM-binding protein YcdF (DUF218 family)